MAEPFIGQIKIFAGNFAPRNWALCDGQILAIDQNQSLYSLLGTTYGGDGRTSFALPDLRGRLPLHPGGNGVTLGQRSGSETTTLTTANLPSHTHDVTLHAEDAPAGGALPGGNLLGRSGGDTIYSPATNDRDNVAMASGSIVEQSVGNGLPINNMQPYLALNFIMAINGLFPSRN